MAAPAPERDVAPQMIGQAAEARGGEPSGEGPVRVLDEAGHLRTLEAVERDLIQLAIETYAGHMTEVARRLGIGRSTLYRKVREQGLEGILDHVG
jgi:DNA-binding NtrC family response regulator